MDRLRGFGTFAIVTAIVLAGLRAVHVLVPMFVPNTRPGPFTLTRLDEVQPYTGFDPVVPAYRPATLGDRPSSLTVWLSPEPTFKIAWQGDHTLVLTQRRTSREPDHPPLAQPLADVPDSAWWQIGSVRHLLVKRGEFWFELETDLGLQDLRRFVDTLSKAG